MGAVIDKETSAATAVGTDLLAGKWYQRAPFNRVLTSVGLTGSAAAGDFACDLFVGNVKVASLLNVATGAPTNYRDMSMPLQVQVPAGVDIHLYVTDASSTNPGYWVLTWIP